MFVLSKSSGHWWTKEHGVYQKSKTENPGILSGLQSRRASREHSHRRTGRLYRVQQRGVSDMKMILNILGWIVVGAMFAALGLGMVIAVASSSPMM